MKIKRILIISMMFILLFTSFSFANDYSHIPIPSTFSADGIPYSVNHYYLLRYHDNKIVLMMSDGTMTLDDKKINTTGDWVMRYKLNSDYSIDSNTGIRYRSGSTWDTWTTDPNRFLATNRNIRGVDGTVFFSKTTRMVAVTTTGMMMTIHQLVGLIPYLIGLWIIWVAFSKAWQFLLKLLRMA